MPDAEAITRAWPLAAALAALLTAGTAALVLLAGRRTGFSTPWKTALGQMAAASPWGRNDLLILLLLVAIAQLARRFLPASVAWDLCAFQGILIFGILWRARRKPRPFGAAVRVPVVARQAVLRWLAILPVLWFAAFVWQLLLRATGYAPDLQNAIRLFVAIDDARLRAAFAFAAVVLVPFAEEVLFRGILLPLLVRGAGAAAGLAVTAIGFAALHADPGTFPALGIFSVALSLAYARTGTLWVPVGMHMLFNGVNLALIAAVVRAGFV